MQMIQQAKDETAESRQKNKVSAGKKPKYNRGADEEDLQIISAKPFVPAYKFNNFGEFLTEESPNEIFSIIDTYRAEVNQDLVVAKDENKKRIVIEDKTKGLKISLKFFKVSSDEEDSRLKMRFNKKIGDLKD
jgi:hypothetical protein